MLDSTTIIDWKVVVAKTDKKGEDIVYLVINNLSLMYDTTACTIAC